MSEKDRIKVLVTGFEPFGGRSRNGSYEAVRLLPDIIEGAEIIKKEIPTEFINAGKIVCNMIDDLHPDIVVNAGEYTGTDSLHLEYVAINLMDSKDPDNAGVCPRDQRIESGSQNAYFSRLPLKKILEAEVEAGIAAEISYSAGAYVCNSVMYAVLNHIEQNRLPIAAGFVHVPSADAAREVAGLRIVIAETIADMSETC